MAKIEKLEDGRNQRAAARDATKRFQIDTIDSAKGREIASKLFDSQGRQFLSTYRTKIANGIIPSESEAKIYTQFTDQMSAQGFKVPPPVPEVEPSPAVRGRPVVGPRATAPAGGAAAAAPAAGSTVAPAASALVAGYTTSTPPTEPAPAGLQWTHSPSSKLYKLEAIR